MPYGTAYSVPPIVYKFTGRAIAVSILAGVLALASTASSTGNPSPPPNILLVLVDDMGFNDLAINGGRDVRTPNLDSFAAAGVSFTRNYVDSTCAATRAGILTGTPPAALGFRPTGLGISPELITLPEALARVGYSTHHVGKWHLGRTNKFALPLAQGFDDFFGFLDPNLLRGPSGETARTRQRPTYRNPWLQEGEAPPSQHSGHLTDILLERVLLFLESSESRKSPWFMNYWTFAPHTPIQPAPRFAGRYPDSPEGRFLALMEQVDDAIGQVLRVLESSGQAENTMVLIASDNGGTNRYRDNNAPFHGMKWTYLEGGVRTPLLLRWPDGFARGRAFTRRVSYLDYMPTLLAAAGATIPRGLQGRDLRRVIAADEDMDLPMFWESGNSKEHAWAVLSADGNWRLSKFFTGDKVLNHLTKDPAGAIDVSDRHPQVVENLHAEFLNWRSKVRRVIVDYEALGDNGRAVLRGESFQRAPGYGGRTFAIAVEPTGQIEEASAQLIAHQPGFWELGQAAASLQLQVAGIELRAGPLLPGECSTVIVTSRFDRELMSGAEPRAVIELFVNGKRVAHKQVRMPSLPEGDFLQPTWIGQDAAGGQGFRGILGRPLLLNERLRADSESDTGVDNAVSTVADRLCPITIGSGDNRLGSGAASSDLAGRSDAARH